MHLPTVNLLCAVLLYSSFVEGQDDYYYDYAEQKSCATSESIIGGTVSYSQGGDEGSVLTYHCETGHYPYPVSRRECSTDGAWSSMPVSPAICKEKDDDYGDYEDVPQNCSTSESITRGTVFYSHGGKEGSVLTYHCESGRYPYPVSERVCSFDGEWSTMKQPNGKIASNAICKEILCPAQLQLDSGEFWPRKQWFRVGENQTFSCQAGFAMLGSTQRNCTQWGDWTGSTPVCNDQADDCRNPGTPPGALRFGARFRIGEKIQYRCQTGLDLLGSAERVCLDSREWSGSDTRCQAQYTFDSPSTVAQAVGASLSAVMDVSSPEFKKKVSYSRTLRVAEGRLNIYILLDASGSISKEHFDEARTATANLIRKLDSYEVNMKFHIISYASQAKDIVSITNPNSNLVDFVLKMLMNFNHTSHGKKTGTNLHVALKRVYDRISYLRVNEKKTFNETQNVILIETDGHSNMGASPKSVLAKIRSLLGYNSPTPDHTKENLLDVYVFGVGKDVNKKQLNDIASSKRNEQHIFILQDYKQLGEVFNTMISDKAVTMCGVAQEDVSMNQKEYGLTKSAFTRPWHVNVHWLSRTCRGSILSEKWVLTAAHCLMKRNEDKTIQEATPDKVTVEHGNEKTVKAESLILHPHYNISGLMANNVTEFYDYDIALVKVESIKLSWEARPICLPCTKPSSRALRMNPNSTCEQHKSSLLHLEETQAHFISKGTTRKQTHIQSSGRRSACIEKATTTFSPVNVSLTDIVTDRFMCTGGSRSHKDAISCKGDSGGALFLRKGMRYFQVAVVSWGTRDVCNSRQFSSDDPPPEARDFHISIFSVMPWLKEHLRQDLNFNIDG